MDRPDNEVMAQVTGGDLGKLAVLFERHHKPLFRFFVHMNRDRELSQDLVQDVFFRILRYRHTYDAKQSFSAWMYQIARNAHLDHIRKRKGEVLVFEDPAERGQEPVSGARGADEELRRRQEIRLLRKALDRLPEDKREVLVLSRYQNLKYEEIAQVLGCEVGTVKVRVYRAVRALGQIFYELAGDKAS